MSIFTPRIPYKPFEYPEVMQFVEAINRTYWVHSEVDFTADIQDFHTKLSPKLILGQSTKRTQRKPLFQSSIHITLGRPSRHIRPLHRIPHNQRYRLRRTHLSHSNR